MNSSAVLNIGTSTMILTSKHEPRWTREEPQTDAKNACVCATRFQYNSLGELTQRVAQR